MSVLSVTVSTGTGEAIGIIIPEHTALKFKNDYLYKLCYVTSYDTSGENTIYNLQLTNCEAKLNYLSYDLN